MNVIEILNESWKEILYNKFDTCDVIKNVKERSISKTPRHFSVSEIKVTKTCIRFHVFCFMFIFYLF
jgi:hypothetical protein